MVAVTPSALLSARVRRDGARPLLVWYGEGGARVELSGVTAANWAAKVANWLLEEHDLQPGDPVPLALAPTWQAAVVALGTWTAGGCVATGEDSLLPVGDGDPLGRALSAVVAGSPDAYLGPPAVEADGALVHGGQRQTHGELAAAARPFDGPRLVAGDLLAATVDALAGSGLVVVTAPGADLAVVRRNEGL